MSHHIIIDKDLFPDLYEGIKEFELKTYKDDIQYYKDNDTITVEDELTGAFFTAVITRINYFSSIDDAFDVYNYKKFIPYAFSKTHAKTIYEKTSGFKEESMNHGVLVFRLTRISEIIE